MVLLVTVASEYFTLVLPIILTDPVVDAAPNPNAREALTTAAVPEPLTRKPFSLPVIPIHCNHGHCSRANVQISSFPGTCPYVTSVGATQIVPGASVTAPEQACQTVIYSGGGFSNVFPLPSYQKSAVTSYFTNHNPPYTATQYNNSRTVRGYPDVAANGANYVVAVDGTLSRKFITVPTHLTLNHQY